MIKKWVVKAFIQGTLSFFPQSARWNYFFQSHITKSAGLTVPQLKTRLDWCGKHLAYYQQYHAEGGIPQSVLELGTGWFPVVPIGLYLSGVETIYTVDITPLINADSLYTTIRIFQQMIEREMLGDSLPVIIPERVKNIAALAHPDDTRSIQEKLRDLHIHYMICDARTLPLPDVTIDFLVSNTTLEHIPGSIIEGIFNEFFRVAKPDALMSHFIDMSDHYSHFDSSISRLNYLKYNHTTWRLFNNSLQYQNRLRISQYRQMHLDAGFDMLAEMNRYAAPEALDGIKVAEPFRNFSRDDLLGTGTWMISRKNAQA